MMILLYISGYELSTNFICTSFITKTFSPRGFASTPVEEEKIELLFEAARIAPSSFNEQPWRFIYATKENPVLYNKLLDCLAEKTRPGQKRHLY
jgi:nitroreductase